jgi:glutaconate CoA-transferase subunit A
MWDEISRDQGRTEAWLDEWVYGVDDRAAYIRKLGDKTVERLKPGSELAGPVDYGAYHA